ncbi:FYVE, RhoGEF and PH domain-containing protein 5 isoform X2 [Ascaphus truei]|uniref:FYVE, RhoGEF and PH domain-containing protein 5 isoform X2 n=1 Tax=Ascaphus truei TaxID=8439 RepID=UPI003F59A483
MSTEVTKPALAPKPQGLEHFTSVSGPKYPSPLLSRAVLLHQTNSMSRGPKPPIAPKPVLSPAAERRSIENANNSLNKCTNGEVVGSVEEIYDTDHYSLDCSESEVLDVPYEEYIVVPDCQLTDDESGEFECENSTCFEVSGETWGTPPGEGDINHSRSCSSPVAGEEDSGLIESVPSRDAESGESTEMEDSDNTDALSLRSSSTAEADSLVTHSGCEMLPFKNDLGDMEDFLPLDSNECNIGNEERERDLKIMGCRDVILTHCLDNLPVADETSYEEDNCDHSLGEAPCDDATEQSCNATDESALTLQVKLVDDDSLEESLVSDVPPSDEVIEVEKDLASECLDHLDELIEDSTSPVKVENEKQVSFTSDSNNDCDEEQEKNMDSETNKEDTSETNPEVGEDSEERGEEVMEEDNIDNSCQIIPYENEDNEDVDESLEGTLDLRNDVAENLLSESLTQAESDQTDDVKCVSEKEHDNKELESNDTQQSAEVINADGERSYTHNEDPSACTRGDVMEGEEDDTAEMSPESAVKEQTGDPAENAPMNKVIIVAEEEDDSNPYVLEDSVQSRSRKLICAEDPCPTRTEEDTLRPHCMMEECDYEGENHLLCIDRKNIVTRARSYSGKIPGNVPETVPEETGAEADSQPSTNESLMKTMCNNPEVKQADSGRALPRKPSRFILYPRSYSVEGRDNTASVYRESDELNFSSPYVISSSGSFSQRNHHSSSGVSTPSSLVDIPPPFELASITKKPITKSSPSLLIENESSEKCFKKKKSSFKRFLTLKFKKKTENKVHVDVNVSSSRSSSESSYHGASRLLDLDRRSLGNSPQLQGRYIKHCIPDSPSAILFYKDMKRKGASKAFSRSVARVESFEERSRPLFMPMPLTKPRSISFPNADTSDYENIPALSSDYENVQIPPRRPTRAGTFTEFFEDPSRALSSANENDGYVDMSSFNTFEIKQQTPGQDAESAYTEPYKVCPISVSATEDVTSDEEQKSSEDEGSCPGETGVVQKKEGPMRALSIVKDLLTSEKVYVEMLKRLHTEFHMSVLRVLGDEEEDAEEELRLRHGLSELHEIYSLHQEIVGELAQRILHWEQSQKIADVFLCRASRFQHHTAFIVAFDKTAASLEDCSLKTSQIAAAVREFERILQRGQANVKHELMKVVQRVFQYHMIFTDYLNNLCPDLVEYEDTQAALLIVSEVADRANDSMRQGENLQKLVQIEYSVSGQSCLLQPGRMNDVLLYTYPQKDGKYRLKNTLSIPGMRVSRPIVENAQNVLKIECMECCLMLSASSCSERDEWYSCISRTVQEYYKAPTVSVYHNSIEIRERLGMCLGERPPSLVPVSHVMMCMNCGSDFTMTLRRHHCHACGKIVCRSCSRNKYPLKYLKDRPSKVCNGCYTELRKRELAALSTNSSPPLSRSPTRAFSSVFHNIHPSYFKKHKKIPSALMEAAAAGENASISGYLHRCKKGKKYWKKRWFVIKGKVLYTYTACEDRVATESLPLLGFTVVPDKWDESPKLGTVFQLYHKQTLFYSFKAADTNSAIRWVGAIKSATVL